MRWHYWCQYNHNISFFFLLGNLRTSTWIQFVFTLEEVQVTKASHPQCIMTITPVPLCQTLGGTKQHQKAINNFTQSGIDQFVHNKREMSNCS